MNNIKTEKTELLNKLSELSEIVDNLLKMKLYRKARKPINEKNKIQMRLNVLKFKSI